MNLDSVTPEPEFLTTMLSPRKLEAETLGKAMGSKQAI